MPLQATSGAASYDAFGGGVAAIPNYIEDVFSTYLYTGNGSTQTITNGIDLAGKGGLVWTKARTNSSGVASFGNNQLSDTALGLTNSLCSNDTSAYTDNPQTVGSVTSTGFVTTNNARVAYDGNTYVSWTFRKQPKFFDVVTWTGTDNNARNISHNLGSVAGCIVVKNTSSGGSWYTYHKDLGYGPTYPNFLFLNTTASKYSGGGGFFAGDPTSTYFPVGGDFNITGETYVAYLFAHNAGGFGLTGTDNVISCGSFTTDGSGNATVSLGYEPQWVLAKKSSDTGNWFLTDTMRGFTAPNSSGADTFVFLNPNTSDAEAGGDIFRLNSTGVNAVTGVASDTYIYIAIRKGPMKVPTVGTSVFGLSARTGTGANATVTGGQTDDAVLVKNRGSAVASLFSSRLTGKGYLVTSSTAAEVSAGTTILQANPWDVMDGVKVGTTSTITNASSNTFINYLFKRAPSFMDVVCYTGTGTATTQAHNLQKVPELMIVKKRSAIEDWPVYPNSATEYLLLNATQGIGGAGTLWNNTTPTSSVFSIGTSSFVNTSAATYVAYLFSTCAGVSKVGSYTGTATTLQIDCGFTGGARFILIKRTDDVGDWYYWDTARGIVAGNDSYLLLNTTAAQVTTTDYIDTYSAGFEISSTAPDAINASGGTFIFLAIA